jgi:hypothetical protein
VKRKLSQAQKSHIGAHGNPCEISDALFVGSRWNFQKDRSRFFVVAEMCAECQAKSKRADTRRGKANALCA